MSPPQTNLDPLLTVEDLAKLLKVSKRTVWRWVSLGRLPQPVRCSPSCVRWQAAAVRQHIEMLASQARKR